MNFTKVLCFLKTYIYSKFQDSTLNGATFLLTSHQTVINGSDLKSTSVMFLMNFITIQHTIQIFL